MPKSISAPLSQLKFPATCVICLSPAAHKYKIQQVFTYGRRSHTIIVDVPMCDSHYQTASFKSTGERLTEILGLIGGIVAGIFGAILLFLRWQGDANWIVKIFAGGVVGFGFFILTWWVIAVLIAPHLATPESREVRSAVIISRYIPRDQLVQLEFRNERMADLMQEINK